MALFKRDIEKKIKSYKKFPVVAILGPRQSGKTTLAQQCFKKHTFVSFEHAGTRQFALEDPERFLKEHENKHGIIIDEFQYVPHMTSYIMLAADAHDRPGYFVLTGSQNYLMNQAITQSLAGRVGILTLLPMSNHELSRYKLNVSVDQAIINGCYPRIYKDEIAPHVFYPSYIHTYVERDVRQLINVGNLATFQKFMQLCAGRIGQLLNINDIATNCGIDQKTAKSWLSTLQAGYIIFILQPHFTNFNKRVTKTPKLYFYDTGLACALLGIETVQDVAHSPFRGHLFESFIIADLYKQYYNIGRRPPLYFWRDQNGRVEVDCVIDRAGTLIPIEIKSGQTINTNFFDGLKQWYELAKMDPENGYLIYAGDREQRRNFGHIIGWQQADTIITKID